MLVWCVELMLIHLEVVHLTLATHLKTPEFPPQQGPDSLFEVSLWPADLP